MSCKKLKPCPFCGIVPELVICNAEGNFRDEDYLNDPWSGVSYTLTHPVDNGCVIATHDGEQIGKYLYDSKKELINIWNSQRKDLR